MKLRNSLATMAAVGALVLTSGCAVTRGQESAGAYVDDAKITATVKGRMVDDHDVDASAIKVETLKGTVQLSGFARNAREKHAAEEIAMKVDGVRNVRNDIIVRP